MGDENDFGTEPLQHRVSRKCQAQPRPCVRKRSNLDKHKSSTRRCSRCWSTFRMPADRPGSCIIELLLRWGPVTHELLVTGMVWHIVFAHAIIAWSCSDELLTGLAAFRAQRGPL